MWLPLTPLWQEKRERQETALLPLCRAWSPDSTLSPFDTWWGCPFVKLCIREFPMWSVLTLQERGPFHQLVGVKVLALCSAFSGTILAEDVGEPCYSLARMEFCSPQLTFTGVSVGGVTVFLWCLAEAEWLLSRSFFVLLGYPFPDHLAGKDRLLFVCLSLSLFFLVCPSFFNSKSGINETKIKCRDFTTVLFLGS